MNRALLLFNNDSIALLPLFSGNHEDEDEDDEEDDYDAVSYTHLKSAHYVDVGKSKLRANTLEIKDEKYQGSKGSRKDLFDNDNENVSDSGSSDEANNNEDDVSDSDDAISLKTDSEDELISESEEESGDSEAEEEDEDTELKRERLAKLVQQETKQVMNKLSQSIQRDAAKGYSIANQNRLFDNIIDMRIKLQKAVTNANKLPITKESWNTYTVESKETTKLLNKSSELVNRVLGQLINFRKDFQRGDNINQDIDSNDETSLHDKKRSFDDLNKDTDNLDEHLTKYRRAVLHKWSSKVTATSGNSALSSTKFKAINQPTDKQVENQLADLTRLRKRTYLNRRNLLPLGFQDDLKEKRLSYFQADADKAIDGEEEEDINQDIPKNYDPRRKDNNAIDTTENPYIFDDEDFYRVLLSDVVDKKTSNVQYGSTENPTVTISSRSNNKLKKNIDTKASKGRKLNYSVQDPIANFEAPINSGYKWNDEQIDEFFAGLLGQRINFNEDENEDDNNSGDDKEELEAIKNDDIQIFG